MRIKSCLRASEKCKKRLQLLFAGLCLLGIVVAFAPVAAAQMTEKVLYSFGGNSNGTISPLVRDAAGNLYGTTFLGGANETGTVFKVDVNGKETVLYNFGLPFPPPSDGNYPLGGLVMDQAGNLYGTTVRGGNDLGGTVFKLDPTGKETVLYMFNPRSGTDGTNPVAGLIIDSAGNLYGTTPTAFNNGTVFKVGPTGTETVLYTFTGTGNDGANPQAGLVMDSAGNLYGTTLQGGTNGLGIVFKLSSTGQETVLHSFTGTGGDGASPMAALIMDSAGNLYGTTTKGGTDGKGVVFKLDPTGSETVLHSFTGTNGDGGHPQAALVMDSANNLYGTTTKGGKNGDGVIFKLDPTGTETVLRSFNGTDGAQPQANLILDSAGNLYGTTWLGGATGGGTVFQLDSAGKETVLFSFAGINGDGTQSGGSLFRDSAGNLYGTTALGGISTASFLQGAGTVFKLDPTSQETVLHRFKGTADGYEPQAGLVQDSAGNFYGTTYGGGAGYGIVFELNASGQESVLYSFKGTSDGQNPQRGLIIDSAGKLYGVTPTTLFKLNPTTGKLTVLHTFPTGPTDGTVLQGGVIEDSAGNLYGTTYYGGAGRYGTVFKVNASGQETVLYSFAGTGGDGANPQPGLVMDSAGNLYGATYAGGTDNYGTVFKVDPTGNETVLYSFTGTNGDGINPQGYLILDTSGNLYGTTLGGSAGGTAFKLSPAGQETVLFTFGTNAVGGSPQPGLIMDSAGNLYGTTAAGGTYFRGLVFELMP